MLGHTDKATINERVPMSPEMRSLLKYLSLDRKNEGVKWSACSNLEKNRLRALMDRGLALPNDVGVWFITEAGREIIEKPA